MSEPAPQTNLTAERYLQKGQGKRRRERVGCGCGLLLLFFLFCWCGLGPIHSNRHGFESNAVQSCRTIALAMFQYANDNNGSYPDGASSTEVFQKLLDGNYVSDPGIFFVAFSGKTKAASGQKLKPENVCLDVTAGVDAHAPDGLPLVFWTGYKVNYRAGGTAVPLIKPWPGFDPGGPAHRGLAVCYFNNGTGSVFSARFTLLPMTSGSESFVPNFLSPDFKPDGKTYRQLTPDGPLP